MGDPWKSITPKGVQAFVNATIATVIVWLSVENHISMITDQLSLLLSSQTFALLIYYLIAIIASEFSSSWHCCIYSFYNCILWLAWEIFHHPYVGAHAMGDCSR